MLGWLLPARWSFPARPRPRRRAARQRGYYAVADRLMRSWPWTSTAALRRAAAHDDPGQRRPAARARRGGGRRPRRARPATMPARGPSCGFLTGPRVWTKSRAGPTRRRGGLARRAGRPTHPVFDTEAVEGLAAAYGARSRSGSTRRRGAHPPPDPARRASPRLALARAAAEPVQLVRDVFAADARVNGTRRVARHRALGATSARFGPRGADTSARACASTTCPRAGRTPLNFDSPEYANIVLGFARVTGRRGPPGCRGRALGLLRDWVRRVIAGYWTHAGSLNWDTGLGFPRWHQRKKVAARAGRADRRGGRARAAAGTALGGVGEVDARPWPRALRRGDRARAAGSRPRSPTASTSSPQNRGNAYLAAARYAANAMRALHAGLGRAAAAEPPALYAFDPDTGRLAVTTPTYNTAIVAVNQRAFPYGGLDLARLFDAVRRSRPASAACNRAAFGLACASRGRARAAHPVRQPRVPGARRCGSRAARGVRAAASARRRLRGPVHRPAGARRGARRRLAGDERLPLHAARDRGALDRGGRRRRRGRHLPELGPRRAGPRDGCAVGAPCVLGGHARLRRARCTSAWAAATASPLGGAAQRADRRRSAPQ